MTLLGNVAHANIPNGHLFGLHALTTCAQHFCLSQGALGLPPLPNVGFDKSVKLPLSMHGLNAFLYWRPVLGCSRCTGACACCCSAFAAITFAPIMMITRWLLNDY